MVAKWRLKYIHIKESGDWGKFVSEKKKILIKKIVEIMGSPILLDPPTPLKIGHHLFTFTYFKWNLEILYLVAFSEYLNFSSKNLSSARKPKSRISPKYFTLKAEIMYKFFLSILKSEFNPILMAPLFIWEHLHKSS